MSAPDHVGITADVLDAAAAQTYVTDARAGAISLFVGLLLPCGYDLLNVSLFVRAQAPHATASTVSRRLIRATTYADADKLVVRLEYEAYDEMAVREMNKLCTAVRDKYQVVRIWIQHRVGFVYA